MRRAHNARRLRRKVRNSRSAAFFQQHQKLHIPLRAGDGGKVERPHGKSQCGGKSRGFGEHVLMHAPVAYYAVFPDAATSCFKLGLD